MKCRSLSRDLRQTLWGVVRHGDRFSTLLRYGPTYLKHLARFLTVIIPQALDELAPLTLRASRIPDAQLREQAVASIAEKAYHVQGGCVLATFLEPAAAKRHIAIVTPLETIYDYLDNLCDRLPSLPPSAYPTVHEALYDAVDLSRTPTDYYRDCSHNNDGGYLRSLVDDVRAHLHTLPHYERIKTYLCTAVEHYCDLQAKKHLPPEEREAACRAWFANSGATFAHLRWYEFAAACGSSLPVFAMLALAEHPSINDEVLSATFDAYLPALSSVHIMLDYFIDQAEDREHDELNFVACYKDNADATNRLSLLIRDAHARILGLVTSEQHTFVLRSMLGFYLTHPKIFAQSLDAQSRELLAVPLHS